MRICCFQIYKASQYWSWDIHISTTSHRFAVKVLIELTKSANLSPAIPLFADLPVVFDVHRASREFNPSPRLRSGRGLRAGLPSLHGDPLPWYPGRRSCTSKAWATSEEALAFQLLARSACTYVFPHICTVSQLQATAATVHSTTPPATPRPPYSQGQSAAHLGVVWTSICLTSPNY